MPPPDLRAKRAIIFDLDGTLYHQKPVRRAMLLRLLRAHALRPVQGFHTIRFLSAFRRAQEELRGESGPDGAAARQIQVACERTGMSVERGARLVARWMEEEPLPLLRSHRREGLPELLGSLRSAGKRLALLSDYPAQAKLAALESDSHFEEIISAQDPEVGEFKPSPRGILVALERLGAERQEALYVGDRPDVDHAAAQAAGIDCVIFTSAPPSGQGYVAVQTCGQLRALLLG